MALSCLTLTWPNGLSALHFILSPLTISHIQKGAWRAGLFRTLADLEVSILDRVLLEREVSVEKASMS